MRLVIILISMMLFAAPVLAQENAEFGTALRNLVTGTTLPLNLSLKDLNSEWTALKISSAQDSSSYSDMLMSLMGGGGGSDMVYTKGDTLKIGTETYVAVYKRKLKSFNPYEMGRSGPPKPEPLKADTKLWLSLLNIRLIQQLSEMTPFDLQAQISSSEEASIGTDIVQEKDASAESVSNLKQLGLAVMQYLQDYDETYPPIKGASQVKNALMPYVKSASVFLDPHTKQQYKFNPKLSGLTLAKLADPAGTVLAYEPGPDKSKTRAVAFADGHVKRIPEQEWTKLKAKQKIP